MKIHSRSNLLYAPLLFLLCQMSMAQTTANDSIKNEIEIDSSDKFVSQPSPDSRSKNLFYHSQDYGSESQFGPLNVFANVGLGVAGRLNASARLTDIDFKHGFNGLGTAYFNPMEGIRQGYGHPFGWVWLEFVPILGVLSWPNYTLHFLGEGMLSRKLEEYYIANNHSALQSKLLAIATITASQQMNEIIEQEFVTPGDAFADLFFNTVGVIAFSFDGFARLFSNESVQLYYWPDQAVVDVRDAAIYNHAENYLLRTTLGSWTSWKFAIPFGLSAAGIGLSIPFRESDYITFGLILGSTNLPDRQYIPPRKERIFYYDEETEEFVSNKVQTDPSKMSTYRIYWDRKGSVLGSLDIAYSDNHFGRKAFHLGTNIYPGIFQYKSVKFGGYAAYTHHVGGTIGITMSTLSVMPGYRF